MCHKKLLIVGAGGHGKVVADAAFVSGLWREIVFIDDQFPELSASGSWNVVGPISDVPSLLVRYPNLVVAIGNNKLRLELLRKFQNIGFALPSIVHPSAVISPIARIGKGTVVFANAIVNACAAVGDGVILNTASSIDHDCLISDGAHISPGVHIGGGVRVGPCAWIGIGATVINGISIGADAVLGAGAVAISRVPDKGTFIGVPARDTNERQV